MTCSQGAGAPFRSIPAAVWRRRRVSDAPKTYMSARTIPLYSYEGVLVQFITPERLKRLEGLGRVRAVVRRRTGQIARVILHRLPGDPRPCRVEDYVGTPYSFRQHLSDGHKCYRLRSLGDKPSETDLAPSEVRPIFLRVVLDCLALAAA